MGHRFESRLGQGQPAAPARLLGWGKGGEDWGVGARIGAVPSAAARPRRCPKSWLRQS